ncbi:MAG: hypothetical protein GQ535_02730 [Rhodobacteraceae bacterium]|nr:hypothetical protein [Paracoccaceae bacterium]
MAIVTLALRVIPFILPRSILQRRIIQRVAEFIPLVIMVVLVSNAFKGHSAADWHSILPLSIGIFTVATCLLWFRIPLFSILAGVAVHMLLLKL